MLLNKSFMNCRIQHEICDELFCFCFCRKQLEQLLKSVSLAYLQGFYESTENVLIIIVVSGMMHR